MLTAVLITFGAVLVAFFLGIAEGGAHVIDEVDAVILSDIPDEEIGDELMRRFDLIGRPEKQGRI